MKPNKWICTLLAAALLLLSGCGGGGINPSDAQTTARDSLAATQSIAPVEETETDGPARESTAPGASSPMWEPPVFADACFHPDKAEGINGVQFDLSAVAEGYIAVSAVSDKRLKFQVIKDDLTYTYDLASDGTPSIYPLQSGDGSYTFRAMENVVDSKYAEIAITSCEVTLADEFQPFLRPNDYVRYTAESDCVAKSREFSASAADDLALVKAVYDYVCVNVRYDTEKAASVKSGYLPEPDETFHSGKGICFDYASLAAAMLRSQGIPTKLICGYVSPDGLYHAWNMFYTEQSGWVTVEFRVLGSDWTRLDLTFSAGGADAEFVGDGSNYSDLYQY